MDAVVEERWREKRRGRILEAAGRVFSTRGFHRAAMDEIAHQAGLGKPTLYRYFPSKDALFEAVFVDALAALETRLERVLEAETEIGAQLTALVVEMLPMFRHHLVPLPVPNGDAAADQSRRRIFRERRARIAGYFAQSLRDGMRRGALREVDAERIARVMIGMIWSAAASSLDEDLTVAADLVDIILHGLVPRDGESLEHDAEHRDGAPRPLAGASA